MERLGYERRWFQRRQSTWLVAWAIILVLLMFHDSHAQIRDLIGTRYAVRALMAEPTATYLADTILNKLINMAHRTTLDLLGDKTLVEIDTIIASNGVVRYTPNSNMASISGVVRRDPAIIGGADKALAEITPQMLGRINQGSAPDFYYQIGGFLILGQSPEGGETLFVYYVPYARNLDLDTTSLQVGVEDHQAVVLLAASEVALRDRQLDLADRLRAMWEFYIGRKMGLGQQAPAGQ